LLDANAKAGQYGEEKLVPHRYDFNERMAMSSSESSNCTVGKILMDNIPGATGIRKSTESEDRQGTDWWIGHVSGNEMSVDCKVRQSDWAATHPDEDDLALEIWSVKEKRKQGWTLDERKRTDYILWLFKDTGRWCLLPFHMLCSVFRERLHEWANRRTGYRRAIQKTPTADGEYTSECVFVPRKTIWDALYEKFGGQLPCENKENPNPKENK